MQKHTVALWRNMESLNSQAGALSCAQKRLSSSEGDKFRQAWTAHYNLHFEWGKMRALVTYDIVRKHCS